MNQHRRRTIQQLLFLIAILGITTSVHAQADVTMKDQSDWWSETRLQSATIIDKVQERQIADTNFQIAGIDLRNNTLATVSQKFGKTPHVQRGDASSGREQACYALATEGHPPYLIFEQGEVNFAFYLFSQTTPWNGSKHCTHTDKIPESVATVSGLHLGQTPDEVLRILGKPSEHQGNEIVYYLHTQIKTAPDILARLRKEHPGQSEEQFRDNYATYDLTVSIRAKFSQAKLVYLGVSVAQTT